MFEIGFQEGMKAAAVQDYAARMHVDGVRQVASRFAKLKRPSLKPETFRPAMRASKPTVASSALGANTGFSAALKGSLKTAGDISDAVNHAAQVGTVLTFGGLAAHGMKRVISDIGKGVGGAIQRAHRKHVGKKILEGMKHSDPAVRKKFQEQGRRFLDKKASTPKQQLIARVGDVANGVSLKRDGKGWYVATHRARSPSYPTIDAIPAKRVEFVESTG